MSLLKHLPWYVPSTIAAIICGGGAVANVIAHQFGWAAVDGGLALVNLGILWMIARTRRNAAKARAEFERLTNEWWSARLKGRS